MKICMITSEFPPDIGGISTYVYNLSKLLVGKGHQVTVITRGSWKNSYFEYVDDVLVYRVRFVPSFPHPFWLHGLWINKLINKLESQFDLIHVHGSLLPSIHTCVPIIFTCHGTSKKNLANIPIRSFHFLVAKMLRKYLIKAEQILVTSADIITTVSDSSAKELKEYYNVNNVIAIYNGVDTSFFTPSQIKTKAKVILYTGRLETLKGLVDLIESAKYVCKEHTDVKFILAGKGTIKKYLEKKVKDLNLESNFQFIGFVDRLKIVHYYQNATIYVLPSYYEGLPTTLLEAMSCGIPSIVTDIEGNSEVVKNYETGLLVPPKNPRKLADAILELLDDDNLHQRLAINARVEIVNKYDWNILMENILNLYNYTIETKNKEN